MSSLHWDVWAIGMYMFLVSITLCSEMSRVSDGEGQDPRESGNRPSGSVIFTGPIINRNSHKCLDIVERGYQDGAKIQQWEYADQPNQNWEVIDVGNGEVAIVSSLSGKVLDVKEDSDSDGVNIQQARWGGGKNQRWRLEKIDRNWYRIVNVSNGKCMDVSTYSKSNGAIVWQWTCHGKTNQQWQIGRRKGT